MISLTRNTQITGKDIAHIGMMVAVIEVCKATLSFLPNIELTSFWIILFTLYFGRQILYVIPIFILIEGVIYGFGLWWVMYLYAWPLLAWITRRFCHIDSVWIWSTISGIYGLSYGLLCSLPYVCIGAVDGGLSNGLLSGFTWWIAGIPFDIIHGIGNFVLMLILYRPVMRVMKQVKYR